MKIKSNLQVILDQRGMSVLKLSKDIQYRYESVRRMYNNDVEHFPKELLLKLCQHLDVTPGELIVIEKEPTE